MAGSLAERLQLIVEATDNGADTVFRRLSGSAKDADDAARKTGASVAAAADRVANARLKEADAADTVRVAETRLRELQEKGNATATQLARAETQVESARRKQHVATREVTSATEAHEQAQRDATDATRQAADAAADAGDASERFSLDLKGLAGTAAGLVGGFSLADWAMDAVSGFISGARASQAMATSMNATVEQAGAFLGLVGSVGLELDDLIEIQAEFATKTKDGLTQLGTELQHNANGTVNWTETLVDTLAELQKIPDATERNRLGFSMFGEEGYKQLSRLLNSGVDVREALEQIGTPFTEEDVELSRQYDAAMMELGQTSGQLGRTLGRAVVPMISGLVDAGQNLVDVLSAVPLPIGAATVAAVILGRVGFSPTAVAAGVMTAATERAALALAHYRTAAAIAGTAAASSAAMMSAAGAVAGATATGASRAIGFLGGPLGVALITAGAAYYYASEGADALEENARDAALELEASRQAGEGAARTSADLGRQLDAEAGYWERVAALRQGAGEALDESAPGPGDFLGFGSLIGGLDESDIAASSFAEAIEKARDELEGFEEQQAITQIATKGLTDLIAEGTTSGHEFADAVQAAAEAQENESRTSDLASAAIEAYNATTRDAVQTTLDLYSAQLGQRDGLIGVQKAFFELADTVDDAETPWNEVTEATNNAIAATLDYASTSADAAVQAARAAGTVITPLVEAQIRADATIAALRESLNDPNMTADARSQIEGLIGQLETAKAAGDIEAVLSLLGAGEVAGELDATTEDRDTTVRVESRNGPAVDQYLDSIADATRLAIVRVESRGGPAVVDYLRGLADARRLAIINVESRGGPAVDAYLDGIAGQYRLAIIHVESRGGPAVDAYLDGLAGQRRVARIDAVQGAAAPALGAGALRGAPSLAAVGDGARFALGTVTLDLELTGRADRAQLSKAERGRARIEEIRAYERDNGKGWRTK